jgi:hypothetical protein
MSKTIEIQAPHELIKKDGYISIFLAGSIEMGKAIDFQRMIIEATPNMPYIYFNPRRNDWDSSWKQVKENENFREQVEWELNALEQADVILMYFDPNTVSPISLLELGVFAHSKKMIVCCPEGYFRKGNIDIVCEKYGIKQVETLEDLISTFQNADIDELYIINK